MVAAYQFDERGVSTGVTRQIGEGDGLPIGWTRVAPPSVDAEQWAVFDGRAGWRVVTNEPPWPSEPAPPTVSRRQARQQLLADGLLSQLESAIDGISDATQREMTRIWYQDADPWERDNSELNTLAEQLELSDEQVDTMFREASKR